MTELRDDKPMWGVGEVLSLAFPAAAGMLGSTIMQFVDKLMVSKLVGPEAFRAQFVSAITAFVPTSPLNLREVKPDHFAACHLY